MVEIIRNNTAQPENSRAVRRAVNLPLRRHPLTGDPIPVWGIHCFGNTPAEQWSFTGSARPRALEDFETSPSQTSLDPGPGADEFNFLLAHWEDIVADFTPNFTTPPEPGPEPPAPGSPPPPPDPGLRRFFRVKVTEIDTNGNFLPDWWELANAYSPFADEGAGYANPDTHDADGDGLTNGQENTLGTDPLNEDTDGDFAPDREEVDGATDPLDSNSCPSFLVSVRRDLAYYISTRSSEGQAEHYWHGRSFWKWSPVYPGWEFFDSESDVEALPACETLRAKLMAKVVFPGGMPDPHPWWYTARYFQAQATLYIPEREGDGGADLIHHRIWHRGPAPTEGPRITPLLKRHDVGPPAVSTTWFVRALTTPTGENYSTGYVDLLPGLSAHPHQSTPQNDPDGDGFFLETENISQNLAPLYVIVDSVYPVLDHETGNITAGWEVLSPGTPLISMVEENPVENRIAHREIRVKIGPGPELAGREVTWTMEPLFTPPLAPGQQGPAQPVFRGSWDVAAAAHRDRFEESPQVDATFARESQTTARSTIDPQGFAAIRVNLPPVGFNKARIFAQVANPPDPTDESSPLLSEKFPVVDVEVPAVVVIDPGHGGDSDDDDLNGSSWNNATSPSGVLEKDMTLRYGLELRDSLQSQAQQEGMNLRVLMTRVTNVNRSGTDRAAVARDKGADSIFIIHFNAFTDDDGIPPDRSHTARGTLEVRRTQANGNVNHEEDEAFMDGVLSRVVPAFLAFDQAANRRAPILLGTVVASDGNLGNTAAYHPVRAGYIEVDFIDYGAHTPLDTADDLVDILLNTGANADWVEATAAAAMRDGILHDLMHQP